MPDFAGPVGFKEWEERGVSVCDSVCVCECEGVCEVVSACVCV